MTKEKKFYGLLQDDIVQEMKVIDGFLQWNRWERLGESSSAWVTSF